MPEVQTNEEKKHLTARGNVWMTDRQQRQGGEGQTQALQESWVMNRCRKKEAVNCVRTCILGMSRIRALMQFYRPQLLLPP